jgi:hypothetical protein
MFFFGRICGTTPRGVGMESTCAFGCNDARGVGLELTISGIIASCCLLTKLAIGGHINEPPAPPATGGLFGTPDILGNAPRSSCGVGT